MIRNVSYEFSSLKWFFLGRIFAPKIEKIVSVDSSDDFGAKIQIEKTSFLKLFRFFEFSRQKGGKWHLWKIDEFGAEIQTWDFCNVCQKTFLVIY